MSISECGLSSCESRVGFSLRRSGSISVCALLFCKWYDVKPPHSIPKNSPLEGPGLNDPKGLVPKTKTK